jgi:hypothetical protein
VVEDNEVNRLVATSMLTCLHCGVVCVPDGESALRGVTDDVDLIFMDCSMPGMDGFEATARLRASGGRRIPIVALTAHAGAVERDHCFAVGMDGVITKPFGPESIARALERWIPRYRSAYAWRQPEAPTLDPQVVDTLRALGGPEAPMFLDEILEAFDASLAEGLRHIAAAADGRDRAALRAASHRLAGAGSSVGATRLARLCHELEADDGPTFWHEAPARVELLGNEGTMAAGALRHALVGGAS